MYPVTAELAELFENQRQVVRITFDSAANNLVLTEENIKSGGFVIDRTCLSGDTIELGSVIASELGVLLNNKNGQFNDVNFEGAECYVEVGTKDWSDVSAQVQYIPMGYFTVDGSPRKLDTISFKALDRMVKFDRPVDFTQLSFPMTVSALLSSICTICGITLNTDYQSTWVNKTQSIPVAPEGDNLTYRQLLSWICEIMGVCAYMSPAGTLNLHWYGQAQSSTPSIPPSVRYNSDVDENAITLTGIRLITDNNTYIAGTDTYALTIEGNALIQSNYQTIVNAINTARNGTSYTPFTASVKSMPYLYPLDTVNFVKGETNIPTIITNVNFVLNSSTKIEGRGKSQIENNYADLNPMTTQQTVVLNKLHSKTVQEFKAADGEVISKIATATSKYDESTSPGTITLRGYDLPTAAGYPAAEHNGEYYLNLTTGYVYLSNGSSWTKKAELTLITSNLSTEIIQTDAQIRADVAATYSTKSETTDKADAAEAAAKAYTDSELTNYTTTTDMNTVIDQTATRISSEANARLEATVGYSSKNLLELAATTTTKSGITFTVDKTAGTVTINGTCTASSYTTLALGYVTNNTSTPLNFYMSGGADGGANDKYYLYAQDTSVEPVVRLKKWNGVTQSESVIDSTTSAEIQIPAGHTGRLMILVRTGITVTDIVFRPMIRDGSITDNTFEPFKATVQTQINEANSTIIQTAHGITQTVAAANAVEYIIPPGVIVNYHGYGFAVVDGQIDYTTTDTGISATGNTGKFFLDQSTGMLYVSDGTTWNNSSKQQLPEKFSEYKTASETSTEINQTANEITLSVMNKNGDYVVEPIFEPKLVTQTKSGVTLTKQDDDSYIISGTTGSNPETFIISTESGNNPVDLTETAISENGSYLIRGTGDMRIGMWITYGESYSRTAAGIHDASFTLTNADTVPNTILVGLTANTQFDNVKFYPRIYNSSDITKLGVADGALCSKISLSDEQIVLGTGRLIINAGNFQLDRNGTVSMTGGKIKTNNYSPASGSTKTVGGKLNLSAIGNNLLLDTANFKIEGDGDVSATNTTLTGGVIKTSNYAAASGNTKTVGGQINLNATGSTPMIDTANFKVSGGGAVSAEDATFTNCTIEGGSFEVDSTEQSGQVTSRIHFSNSYLGDGESIEISSEKIEMSRINTGNSRNILLDCYNANTGSELKLETQSGSTWDKALYSASKIKFDTRTSPAASITYVDANNNERNALVFGGSPQNVTLGDKDTITKILGTQTYISSIDSNNVEHSVFGYVGGAVSIGNRDIPVFLTGSSITANGKKLISDIKTNPATTLPITLTNAYAGNVVDWTIYGNAEGVGERTKNAIEISTESMTRDGATLSFDPQTGTVILSGDTAEATSGFSFTIWETSSLSAGEYIFSGGADGGRPTTYDLYLYNRTDHVIMGRLYSSSDTIDVMIENDKWYTVYVQCRKEQAYNDVVFKPMLRLADTTPEFIPYGYQVPITVSQADQTDKNYEIFIGDSPLPEGQSVSSMSAGQDIGLFEGENTISTTLTNKPKMTIKYFTT